MPTTIRFDFLGDAQLDRTLMRLELGARNAAPAFDAMGRSLALAEQKQFKGEGAYGSGGWAPLSPAYAREKRRRYGNLPILQRTGTLKAGLTGRPFAVDVVEAQFAVFGTDLNYAGWLQRGTDRMPARPVIDLPETVRQGWIKIMQRWLLSGEAKS